MLDLIAPEERQRIYEECALWMLRREEGRLTEIEELEYAAWLKLSHRAEAFDQMQAFSKRLVEPWRRRRIAIRLAAWRNDAVTVPF